LIKYNIDLDAETSFKRKALHIAAIKGHLEIGKLLIENKVDINCLD
jgi:ankyrin repeat protein